MAAHVKRVPSAHSLWRPEVGSRVHGLGAKLLLDAQQLVVSTQNRKEKSVSRVGADIGTCVLGQALASARRAGLDLARAQANDKVGDEGVFSLAAAVAYHCAPAGGKGEEGCFDALGYCAYLVHFEEQGVASFGVDAGLDALGVGHEKIVANLQTSAWVCCAVKQGTHSLRDAAAP